MHLDIVNSETAGRFEMSEGHTPEAVKALMNVTATGSSDICLMSTRYVTNQGCANSCTTVTRYSPGELRTQEVRRRLRQMFGGRDSTGSYLKRCVHCGAEFIAGLPSGRYCSYRCTNDSHIESRRQRMAAARSGLSCSHCGTTFDGARKDAKFCSGKCRQAAHRNKGARDVREPMTTQEATPC